MNDRSYARIQCPGCGQFHEVMIPKKGISSNKTMLCKRTSKVFMVRYNLERQGFEQPKEKVDDLRAILNEFVDKFHEKLRGEPNG